MRARHKDDYLASALRVANAQCLPASVNINGGVAYNEVLRDPATVVVPRCSAIGAPIAGEENWDSDVVQLELAKLTNEDLEVAREYLNDMRGKTAIGLRLAYDAYELKEGREERKQEKLRERKEKETTRRY